jgi:catechol 2,3-dioxygenase-like lactoylglutathione lyase family enzyme
MLAIRRTNTIVYCERWEPTVAFYRDALELAVTFGNDWFVEFQMTPESFLSVADHRRATIAAGGGAGLTLSWQVDDVAAVRRLLLERDVEVGPIGSRWGAATVDLHDPEGNRIELWSDRSGPA